MFLGEQKLNLIHRRESHQNEYPYPVQAMLVRYHLPAKIRYTSLLYYGEVTPPTLPDWVAVQLPLRLFNFAPS